MSQTRAGRAGNAQAESRLVAVLTGDGGDHLSHLQPVQDGGFPCAVQAQDQNPHLSGAKQVGEEARKETT